MKQTNYPVKIRKFTSFIKKLRKACYEDVLLWMLQQIEAREGDSEAELISEVGLRRAVVKNEVNEEWWREWVRSQEDFDVSFFYDYIDSARIITDRCWTSDVYDERYNAYRKYFINGKRKLIEKIMHGGKG